MDLEIRVSGIDGEEVVRELDEALARRGLELGDVRVRNEDDGVVVEVPEFGEVGADDAAGWIADAVLAPFVEAVTPEVAGDWLTDRWARRPYGRTAREGYRDPTHHRPSFGAVLEALHLQASDVLLEIGCGGGALLEQALLSGCRAVGVDHSPEMLEVARELNAGAIADGRLQIVEGTAEALPFEEGTFTCVTMTQVFFFVDGARSLAECHRVLRRGGRLAVFTVSPAARGTPAMPEPAASRSHLYTDDELIDLAREAGFGDARVDHPDLEPHARAAGLPADVVELFRGGASDASQLLLASK